MSPGAEKFPELCLPSWVEREQTLKWRRELFNNSQIQFPCLRFPNDTLSFHSIPVLRGCGRRQSLSLLWSDGVKTGKDAGYRRKEIRCDTNRCLLYWGYKCFQLFLAGLECRCFPIDVCVNCILDNLKIPGFELFWSIFRTFLITGPSISWHAV